MQRTNNLSVSLASAYDSQRGAMRSPHSHATDWSVDGTRQTQHSRILTPHVEMLAAPPQSNSLQCDLMQWRHLASHPHKHGWRVIILLLIFLFLLFLFLYLFSVDPDQSISKSNDFHSVGCARSQAINGNFTIVYVGHCTESASRVWQWYRNSY
ncbi:unnamed protein product [Hydatigera taeniaeformis]|uniref:Membrane protein UL146 n=1 Tax=Hydatigena taeniaeformis TaxID=6205 RepID=A0A0R3X6G8_HYDTA|nr:unnamed protein product [Hydatigera taeniaeformis]